MSVYRFAPSTRSSVSPVRLAPFAFWAALVFAAAGLAACGSLDYEFDFSHESPTFVIDTGIPSTDGLEPVVNAPAFLDAETIEFTGGWTGFRFKPDVTDLPAELVGITVREVDLLVTAVSTAEPMAADFIERLELYVIGTGDMPSFLLGTFTRVAAHPDGEGGADAAEFGGVALQIVEEVNLKGYLEGGAEFYCFLQGIRPENQAAVQLLVDFYAYTSVSP